MTAGEKRREKEEEGGEVVYIPDEGEEDGVSTDYRSKWGISGLIA